MSTETSIFWFTQCELDKTNLLGFVEDFVKIFRKASGILISLNEAL